MNPKYKKVYCCTPVAFHANDGFWIRDTGLISASLRNMGVESKCIMPLPYYDDDQREALIRTEYENLESETWWKSLGIDAIILYSWGAPRYRRIAYAVKKAGIRIILHMDTSGDFVGPIPDNASWWYIVLRKLRVLAQDVLRARHMKQADVITMCTPAAEYVSLLPFYGLWVKERHFPMPCPVASECGYDGRSKQPLILCIGRWDDQFQKRPAMLMRTLELLYEHGATAETRIYGTVTPELRKWHESLPVSLSQHIHLLGYLPNEQLWGEYREARIVLCPSRYESSHIVSAEGLCCGCSVVVTPRQKDLRDVIWYTSAQSGTVAEEDTPESLAKALKRELDLWEAGDRNPSAIASHWQPFFHVNKVFNNILN